MEKLKTNHTLLLFLQTCVIFNILHTSRAYVDRSSEQAKEKEAAKIEYLNKNLPQAYYCCKDQDTLQNCDWKMSCVDENKVSTNISINCTTPHFFEAKFFTDSYGYGFNIQNGVVYHGLNHYRAEMSSNDTCFANETTKGQTRLMVIMCLDEEEEMEEDVTEYVKERGPIAGTLSLLSAPFTVIVIIVYVSIPELRDLQSQSILCLCSSFLISSLLIANEDLQIIVVQRICHSGGDILFFTLMASVFWMNAIIAQTFVYVRFPNIRAPWRRQFIWYSCYGWGIPSLLVLWAAIDDVPPGSLVLRSMDMTFNCWRYDDVDEWKYYLGPLAVAVAASFLLLLCSAVMIWKLLGQPQFKSLRYNFMLSLKLFVVVGISWLNEPFQKLHGEQSIMWLIGDCWNLLQGLLLFIVLVLLRKRAMRGILDRYTFLTTHWLRRYTDALNDDENADTDEIVVAENGLFEENINTKEAENK